MKKLRSILSVLLILCLVFPMLPASEAEANTRAVSPRILIDDDPTDGYRGDYVVIYNPDTTTDMTYSTGTLTGLIETTVSTNGISAQNAEKTRDGKPASWKIDVDSLLPKPVKPYRPNPSKAPQSFSVGDEKTFRIYPQYSPTGSGSVQFKCLYVGQHCYIWTPTSASSNVYPLDSINSAYAQKAANEFDSKFSLMQTSFGNHDNGDGDGKLHILYYNIDDGWNGSGSYTGGFFWSGDYSNNNLPMLNIDTYPSITTGASSSMTGSYSTVVHEYQHLINYSNTPAMDTWLNECFSAAAEEICYPGSSVVSRIMSWEDTYSINPPAEIAYNPDFALHNGYSMYQWDNDLEGLDILALYAQVSFFAQYLYTRFGNSIYRYISAYFSDSEVIAISGATGIYCPDLVRDFRVALTANTKQDQYGGIYGFKVQAGYDPNNYYGVQNPWDLLSPIVFTGASCRIQAGGAITVKPVGGVYNPPSDADPQLQYIGVKIASPYIVTAVSNNDAWGAVSVYDTVITATPAEGYYVSGYEVVSGAATAVVDGSVIRVTPQSNCEIRVIFAQKVSCTVSCVALGVAQGSATVMSGDEITLPATVSVNPDGWTFIGWTETPLPGETDSKPAHYAPGAGYYVPGNVTLYAVYSCARETASPFYELVSEAPSDWTGNCVITFGTSDSMYLMKGVSVSSNASSIENNSNAAALSNTGAVLNGEMLSAVPDAYVFTMAQHGSYYSIQNAITGTYIGMNGLYLSGYKTYTSGCCDWTPGVRANAASAKCAADSNFPYLSFRESGPFFWTNDSEDSNLANVRFWKERSFVTYYATDLKPRFASHSVVLSGQIGLNFFVELPALEGMDYSESCMTFEIPHGDCTESDNYDANDKSEDGKCYGFTCYVSSIQMAEPITATFHYKQNGEDKTITDTYSIKNYIAAFNKVASSYPQKTVTLVHALADYGHYVQFFLSAARHWEIGSDFADMNLYYKTNYTNDDIAAVQTAVEGCGIVKDNNTSGDIEDITYSLVLDSETAIRVYFRMKEGYSGTFTVDGYTPIRAGDRYMIVTSGISAHQLDRQYTINVTTENGTATVTVSALSYVKGALQYYSGDHADADAQNAMAALYAYSAAAQAYKTAHTQGEGE